MTWRWLSSEWIEAWCDTKGIPNESPSLGRDLLHLEALVTEIVRD